MIFEYDPERSDTEPLNVHPAAVGRHDLLEDDG